MSSHDRQGNRILNSRSANNVIPAKAGIYSALLSLGWQQEAALDLEGISGSVGRCGHKAPSNPGVKGCFQFLDSLSQVSCCRQYSTPLADSWTAKSPRHSWPAGGAIRPMTAERAGKRRQPGEDRRLKPAVLSLFGAELQPGVAQLLFQCGQTTMAFSQLGNVVGPRRFPR